MKPAVGFVVLIVLNQIGYQFLYGYEAALDTSPWLETAHRAYFILMGALLWNLFKIAAQELRP